jgi:hypothetical protein
MREERAGLGSGSVFVIFIAFFVHASYSTHLVLQSMAITGDNVISASDSYADAVRKRARARYASE